MRSKWRLAVIEQYLSTHDGWSLHLRRTVSPDHFDSSTRPLLIVPGYGMNNFIFGYHPRGTSMERCLAEGGYEVWSFNLRAQGDSRPNARLPGPVSLHAYATVDVPALVSHVLASTRTSADQLTLIGASLGGTVVYAYLALHRDPPVREVITLGAPLRWAEVHPLIKVAFASPSLAGALKISGTREIMRRSLPLLLRAPTLISFYMNTSTIDMTQIHELTRTVEDPHPAVNRDIAVWIRSGDLFVSGVNVTDAVSRVDLPLMVVLSNKDGIVSEATAMTAAHAWGGEVDVLRVGDDHNWYAHANLFVADDAPRLVFDPIIDWLRQKAASG
jgi:pimeloyl-ACP methyl ester carboxylesterase